MPTAWSNHIELSPHALLERIEALQDCLQKTMTPGFWTTPDPEPASSWYQALYPDENPPTVDTERTRTMITTFADVLMLDRRHVLDVTRIEIEHIDDRELERAINCPLVSEWLSIYRAQTVQPQSWRIAFQDAVYPAAAQLLLNWLALSTHDARVSNYLQPIYYTAPADERTMLYPLLLGRELSIRQHGGLLVVTGCFYGIQHHHAIAAECGDTGD